MLTNQVKRDADKDSAQITPRIIGGCGIGAKSRVLSSNQQTIFQPTNRLLPRRAPLLLNYNVTYFYQKIQRVPPISKTNFNLGICTLLLFQKGD